MIRSISSALAWIVLNCQKHKPSDGNMMWGMKDLAFFTMKLSEEYTSEAIEYSTIPLLLNNFGI